MDMTESWDATEVVPQLQGFIAQSELTSKCELHEYSVVR